MVEVRVGYVTVDFLVGLTEEYIRSKTLDGRYVGDVQYLIKYQELKEYLK